ncbi:hypothetical protein GWK47_007463 [Chionoecetes opilio]|uniref:Uncharacterized protein n=1 Tax=Chionoecetes opilio TaxID=41210 RepID=A0A8J5CT42_CHIOP|nr:hypothetical protein GWK47_007463 [Chionoecetes opilio]
MGKAPETPAEPEQRRLYPGRPRPANRGEEEGQKTPPYPHPISACPTATEIKQRQQARKRETRSDEDETRERPPEKRPSASNARPDNLQDGRGLTRGTGQARSRAGGTGT